jgi:hypothetical protein
MQYITQVYRPYIINECFFDIQYILYFIFYNSSDKSR